MTEKLKILKIGRKQQPSKFKPGETYSITTILVPECSKGKNQKLTAMGQWSEGWKEGDEIEGIIEEKKWTDKDGFEQTNFSLTNPNKKEFTPYGSKTFNPLITAYQIAASLAPLIFANKKKVMLEDIDKLALAIKEKLNVQIPSTPEKDKEEKVKEIDVDKEGEKDDTEVEDDEDDDGSF